MTSVANGMFGRRRRVQGRQPALIFEWIAPKLTAAWDAAPRRPSRSVAGLGRRSSRASRKTWCSTP